jgi:hypothetical protein
VPFCENDRASEVIHKAGAGVPYEASIFFDPNEYVLEEVSPGAKVQVNGYELEGPAAVVRQWTLRGVAICPYGADRNTSTELGAGPTVSITLFQEGTYAVPKAPEHDATKLTDQGQAAGDQAAEQKPEEKPAEQAAEQKPEEQPEETPAVPAAQAQPAAALRTGKDFLAAFGDQGARWFVEGRTWDEAQALFAQQLQDRVKDLETKLAAVNRGEVQPVSFSTSPEATPEQAAVERRKSELQGKVSDNLATFAAGMRFAKKH